MLITENRLDQWVRGNARDAQGVIVELVWRLVAAASPGPKERRFPLGDSIGQQGPDGLLDVDFAYEPFVPEGRSFWEIGTGLSAGEKATSDYRDLTSAVPSEVRLVSTFIFVTPLSARRDWPHTWKADAQATWLRTRQANSEWKSVRVIDGTALTDWIQQFPSVELWLAQKIEGIPVHQVETLEQRWIVTSSIGEPPPLTPEVFLVNREEACAKLKDIFLGSTLHLKLDTRFPEHVVDFASACLAQMDDETRADVAGRTLVISGVEAWDLLVARRERHILIADYALDLSGETGTKLIQKARRAGHAVVFGGMPGGIPDPSSASLPMPRGHQLKDALEKAGYREERARSLAQKSGGNLGTLLRCLQNLSLMPEWADCSAAAELAIATLLGSWVEGDEADKAVIENLSGNSYGEWIGKMRDIALRPGAPLSHREGKWKFIPRYEGWYSLGPRLFDEHLDRFASSAVAGLQQLDPRFGLPIEERNASGAHGPVPLYSDLLRMGLAESLALLGNHQQALTSCTPGKGELAAVRSVRAILRGATWQLWASLRNILPLLAEAAPAEFLRSVEEALRPGSTVFHDLFDQERTGATYMSGVLWALETLAWDSRYLGQVVMCLGELAARDPGGPWANRPASSLTTILLPWFPQTCASLEVRTAAVTALLTDLPRVGWKLLLSLLPRVHSISSGSRRPVWRETLPEDWVSGVTQREYYEQVVLYSEITIRAAVSSWENLTELIDNMENLPPHLIGTLIVHLGSEDVTSMPDVDKFGLWCKIMDLITKHRKFANTEWAMKADQVDRIVVLADRLAPGDPSLRHRRLFTERDFDLHEETGNYTKQSKILEHRRQAAVADIARATGVGGVLEFAAQVQSPWRVGMAFGVVAGTEADVMVVPELLDSTDKSLAQFTGGFVRGRFESFGWAWVDAVVKPQWTHSDVGHFLSFLPFDHGTWDRATRLLAQEDSAYWTKTTANPYEAEEDLARAVDKLIQHGRPSAALRCLGRTLREVKTLDEVNAVRALLDAAVSPEGIHSMDSFEILAIITALQDSPTVDLGDMFRVEWAYMRLLESSSGAYPKVLWRRLANEPLFFCEVIGIVFRPQHEIDVILEVTEESGRIASDAYRLLSKWRIPPGSRDDGTLDGDALGAWLEVVRRKCLETGHLEIAMTMVGHALSHASPDPAGLWIHRSVAAALNARDAEDMRGGFVAELYNSRGVHWVDPTGKPEKELEATYRERAEAVERAGYLRLAATMRELADAYEREAKRVSFREPFDD